MFNPSIMAYFNSCRPIIVVRVEARKQTVVSDQSREGNYKSTCDTALNKRDEEYNKIKQNAQNKNSKEHYGGRQLPFEKTTFKKIYIKKKKKLKHF